MKKSLVSVVMSAYNAEKFIADSIRSILDQTYDNWKLIIINDCSSDNTSQIIERFSDNDSRIKLIYNNENLGLTRSLNICLKHAEGEFIARLDADDTSEPLRLEKQVNFLNTHSDIVLVGSGGYLINNLGHNVSRINVISRESVIRRFMTRLNLFIHSSIMVRRRIIEDVGWYREKFRFAQDYDLILRVNDKYMLSNIPDHLVGWRISSTSETMQHHTLQRIFMDIAREFAFERKEKGYDSYDSMDFDEKINAMMKKNYGRYRCEYGVYQALFMKQYKNGLIEISKGIRNGGIPYNAFMRGVVQVIARI
jgi:glycosyltransferase involved in cell wall biosynthesis